MIYVVRNTQSMQIGRVSYRVALIGFQEVVKKTRISRNQLP
jgi:hypothetical protein